MAYSLFMKSVIYSSLLLILLKCGGPSAPKFKIQTGLKANQARWGDTLQLKIKKLPEGATATYFLNAAPIGANHVFTDEPLGIYELKALVQDENQEIEVKTTLTLLAAKAPQLYTYELLNSYPHDINAYTQGLEFDEDILFESTGLNGESSLRTVNYKSGEPLVNKALDNNYFGEGLTVFKDQVIQLTWKSKKGFIYDKETLEMKKSFPYQDSQEGWGLCNNDSLLYKSDGTHRIWTLDPQTYQEKEALQVMTHKAALKNLNELEWVAGKIYANTYQFQKDVVVIIDPKSGAVEGVVDFSGLKDKVTQHPKLNVFNGIAYHPKRKTFFVTGKNWDKLFEVKILPKE